jgi:uncharacterized membrane protein
MTTITETQSQAAALSSHHRIASIDLLRGLLMILMALDHARQFFTNTRIDPTDPLLSWPALFLTRWVTHLCAPGFVALAGTSVYLQRQRGRSAGYMARKLSTRGLWLIFVELTIVNVAIYFNFRSHMLQVIWAIGASMLVLALLQRFPIRWIAGYGFLVIALHNLLDVFHAARFGSASAIWMVLHERGMLMVHGRPFALVEYPLLPWTGVMALGFAFGVIVMKASGPRRLWSVTAGGISLFLFVVLRTSNLYGDPNLFQPGAGGIRSAMSFLALTKYPPRSITSWLHAESSRCSMRWWM